MIQYLINRTVIDSTPNNYKNSLAGLSIPKASANTEVAARTKLFLESGWAVAHIILEAGINSAITASANHILAPSFQFEEEIAAEPYMDAIDLRIATVCI